MTDLSNLMFPFEVRASSLVVFEGLDGAGKSTIHEKIRRAAIDEPEPVFTNAPYFTHQPSGGTGRVGKKIYKLTENAGKEDLDPRARQMLHLASHFQHYAKDILPRLKDGRPVFMDRNYWSTFAYGYFGCFDQYYSPDEFYRLITLPLEDYVPDLVFFFQHPWVEDTHNTPEVVQGYRYLVEMERTHTVVVPKLSIDETIMFVFKTLREQGITKVWR